MLYTKIQPQSFLSAGEDFQKFLPYMDAAAFLFSGTIWTNWQYPFDRRPMWILVKIAQAVSEKTFKNYTILDIYIAQWQGQITLKGKNFD